MRNVILFSGIAGALLAGMGSYATIGSPHPQALGPIRLELTAIEDSGSYYVYRYRVRNPSTNAGGVGSFDIDISGEPTTQHADPASTGKRASSITPSEGRAPLGTITPPGWESFVRKHWSVGDTSRAFTTLDSIAPGDSLTSLGARSQYMPGIRSVWTMPTIQACCRVPLEECDSASNEFCQYPFPDAFKVEGSGVGPTYDPLGLTIGILENQRIQSCGTLQWITDGNTCSVIAAHIASAVSALNASDLPIARAQLDALLTVLHANHDSTGSLPINDNAYWMLLTNARYMRFKVLPPPACGEVRDLPFLAGQTTEAGRVTVWNDATNVYVKYALASGWQLTESHLAVALSIDGIPTNKAGNPIVGQFPYQSTHGAGTTEYTYTVSLAEVGAVTNAELLISAHAVTAGGGGSETGWAEGSRFADQGNWAMYSTYVVTSCH